MKRSNLFYSRCHRFVLLILASLLVSCSGDDTSKMVKKWDGRILSVSHNLQPLNPKDTTYLSLLTEGRPKVVMCTDSMRCGPCQLKLPDWDKLIKKYKSSVDFIFVVYPRNRAEILAYSKNINFRYSLFIDYNDEMETLNKLPEDSYFRCFLIDKNKQVLLIGNPTYNDKLMSLYTETLDSLSNQTYGLSASGEIYEESGMQQIRTLYR